MDIDNEPTGQGFWATVRRRSAVLDVVLLVSVPAVFLGVASLSPATRASFAFRHTAPSLETAYVSSFVHLGSVHLAVNLAGYLVVVPVAYLLSVLSGHRRRFRVAFVSLVLACPFLLSYLNLAIVRRSVSVWFSGVLMALYGYLLVALATYLDERFDVGPDRTVAPLFSFVGLTLITVLTLAAVSSNPVTVPVQGVRVPVGPVLTATLAGLIVALALVVVLYGLSAVEDRRALARNLRRAVNENGYFELAVVAGAVFLAVPVATFPVEPVVDGSVRNLYTHLLGYTLGFTGTYATVVVERTLIDLPSEM
jgi:hypothetical protein